jgi:nonribosomal peptide synthetase protein BlmX
LADQLGAALMAVLAGDGRLVRDLDLFTDAAHRLLDGVNQAGDDDPPTAPALFAEQVRRHADRPAVADADRTLTYAGLDDAAGRLARKLRGRGVGVGATVAVCLPPGCDMPVAVLGVMRTGAAWLPVDPAWPVARIRRILRDARPELLVTHEALLAAAGGVGGLAVMCLDGDAADLDSDAADLDGEADPDAAGDGGPDPDDLAYVMYTSGSTGAPKGVAVTHRGLGNYLAWSRDAYGISPETSSLVHTSLAFDLTLTSLLGPLVAGGRIRFAGMTGIDGLVRGLTGDAPVDLLKLTPAHLRLLASGPDEQRGRLPATVVVGGEALTEPTIADWRDGSVLVNEYGPTETVVGCCAYRDRGPAGRETVPIGRPIARTRLYVLDGHGRRVGIGIPGELHVGGAGVARGYQDRPDLTAERFVPDPTTPGARVYRTGDIARYLPTGDLEYLGRGDDQVQVQGMRVELGEVEWVVARHPDVAAAAAAVRGEPATLHVWVVAAPGAVAAPAAVRSFVADRLPAGAVPATVTVVAELPLTANGKVDRGRLPDPAVRGPAGRAPVGDGADYQAPRGQVEETIARIWAETLGVDRVGVDDNFFDLGGHSFLLVELAGRLQKEFGDTVSVLTVVEHPTVAALAAALRPGDAPAEGAGAGEEAADRAAQRLAASRRSRERHERDVR